MTEYDDIDQLISAETREDFIKPCHRLKLSGHIFTELCKRLQLSAAILQIPAKEISLKKISALIHHEHKQSGLSESNQNKRESRRERKRVRRLQAIDTTQTIEPIALFNDPNIAYMVLENFIRVETKFVIQNKQLNNELTTPIVAQSLKTLLSKKALWLKELDEELSQTTAASEKSNEKKSPLAKLISYNVMTHEELLAELDTKSQQVDPTKLAALKSEVMTVQIRLSGKAYIQTVISRETNNVIKSPFGKKLGKAINSNQIVSLDQDVTDTSELGTVESFDTSCSVYHQHPLVNQSFAEGIFGECLKRFFADEQAWFSENRNGQALQGGKLLPLWFEDYRSSVKIFSSEYPDLVSEFAPFVNVDGRPAFGFDWLLNITEKSTETLREKAMKSLNMVGSTVQRTLVRLRNSLVAILLKYERHIFNLVDEEFPCYNVDQKREALFSHAHAELCEQHHQNAFVAGYIRLSDQLIMAYLVPFAVELVKSGYQKRHSQSS